MQMLLIHAIYEDGVLKPEQPLPLAEREIVRVSIESRGQEAPVAAGDPVRASYGILGWTGDAATVERLAMDPEFGIEEAP